MDYIWTEYRIRQELRALDRKTGLKGAELPIRFTNNEKATLGKYSSAEGGCLYFSNYWFQNPTWSRKMAVDTIRHEYAHYMCRQRYGARGSGHGPAWKNCCREIGAMTSRLYSERIGNISYHLQQAEDQKQMRLNSFQKGVTILHPQYGAGTIEALDAPKCVTINFDTVGQKRLSLEWVDKNCRKTDGEVINV